MNQLQPYQVMIRFTLPFMALLIVACSARAPWVSRPTGRAYVEAEALFRHEPRWLGADAALTIPLTDDRVLWLFDDTFVAVSDAYTRKVSKMVRNTVAIQIGVDPRTASMTFHWRQDANGSPASFFPERGSQWYWPRHGILLDEGPLVIFLFLMGATPGQGLGFAHEGYALALIDNPHMSPEMWNLQIIDGKPNAYGIIPATAVVQDGEYIVALAIHQESTRMGEHPGMLVRYPSKQLAQGNMDSAEWWAGERRGWLPESELSAGGPAYVLDDAGAECSLHWDERTESFIHVASYGFGDTTIGLRTAPAITGPWSSPITVYDPPESDRPQPFVYAAKAHPKLAGPNAADLVVTYATNSFEFSDLFTMEGERSLYWPRLVLVPVGK
ncbi:MAG: DUF4185 domain-containing protein [Chloroflexota bacterium]